MIGMVTSCTGKQTLLPALLRLLLKLDEMIVTMMLNYIAIFVREDDEGTAGTGNGVPGDGKGKGCVHGHCG